MTPLLAVALAYGAGLLIGLRAPLPLALPITAACALAPLLLLQSRRILIATAFLLAGVLVGSLRARMAAHDCREQLADGARVQLIAVPLVQPLAGTRTRAHARLLHAAGVSCTDVVVRLHAQARHTALLDSAAHGRVAALHITGQWLRHARRTAWPRASEYAGGVLVDGVRTSESAQGEPERRAAGAAADRAAGVAAERDAGEQVRRADLVTRFRTAQQARMRALLPQRWGLAEAVLLAQKSGLTPDTRTRWVAAGLVHLLAISGMHVGLIAAGVLLWCRALRLPQRTARRCALVITAAYVLFIGAPSAALRALLQATLLLGSVELQRPAEPLTALAAAGLVILLLEPLAIIDPGFQLSFAGMIGLIGWRRPVLGLLPAHWPAYLRDGVAAGLAASMLTMPIAALHFGTVSWIGIPASLLAVPVLAAAIGLLLLALLMACVTGSTTGMHASLADAALRALDGIAELAARMPGGHGYVAAHTVLSVLGAIAVAIVVRRRLHHPAEDGLPPPSHASAAAHEHYARRGMRRRLRLLYATGAAVVVVAWAPFVLRPHADSIEIHAIDVGQGDAFAIRTPKGRWIVVDAGPRTARRDAGRMAVVPFLLARGARRIDAFILTHPDADHIGGAAAVLEAFDVGVVIDPGLVAGKDMFIDLVHAARTQSQRWIAARDGISFHVDGVRIFLIYPLAVLDAAASANDNSVVFRLTYGDFAALFLGDAPTAVEELLLARHGQRLRATLLKVGHHGSMTSTSEALLDTARPALALVSAGRNNRYGHPAPVVLRRLARHEVRVLRTDEHGDITVRAHRDGRAEVLTR